MWQPDGWGQTRIGVLAPHADIVPETEFNALLLMEFQSTPRAGGYKPGGTMDPTIADNPARAFADPPAVDDAAEMLGMAPLHAIVFGFTSSSGAQPMMRCSNPVWKLAREVSQSLSRARRRSRTGGTRGDTSCANQSTMVLG